MGRGSGAAGRCRSSIHFKNRDQTTPPLFLASNRKSKRTKRRWRAPNDTGAHETGRRRLHSLRVRRHSLGRPLPPSRRSESRFPRMPAPAHHSTCPVYGLPFAIGSNVWRAGAGLYPSSSQHSVNDSTPPPRTHCLAVNLWAATSSRKYFRFALDGLPVSRWFRLLDPSG